MLLLSYEGSICRSHSHELWHGKGFMVFIVFSIQDVVGAPHIIWRDVDRLAWFLCGLKEKKRVAGYSLMLILEFRRKEIVGYLKMRGIWSKGLKSLSFVIFGCGLCCIEIQALLPLLILWTSRALVEGVLFFVVFPPFCGAFKRPLYTVLLWCFSF